ncbi:TPA: major capsid family protein, partial [Shigella flexneri 2a]
MITFDQATVDSSGAFLIGELERLDQTLNLPLVGYTWSRDIQLREDASIADDISSWTNTSFAAAGTGANPNGKNWVGKDSTAIAGVNVDIGKSGNPLNLWGMELGWTVIELQAAQQVGRPIDTQK